MVQLDFQKREITVKVVYYGPALSGKTTNLEKLHQMVRAGKKGELLNLDTHGDRTLFFDLLPIHFRAESGVALKLKVYTVPGQVMHNATRRMVLKGADGVAFIADSQVAETQNNNDSFSNLMQNLRENDMKPADVPIVIQFNKRDLTDIRSDEEIERIAKKGKEPVFKASAISGHGVLPTFLGLASRTWDALEARYEFASKFGLGRADFLRELETTLGVPK